MKELSIEQCRPYLIGILKHIDSFCRENNIKYSLAYGSLIGAIRHKGFIPWDDDIDIIMPRDDYDKFLELHELKTHEIERYRVRKGHEIANHLHAVVSDEDTTLVFQKGTTDDIFYHGGLRVDLFPLDNCSGESAYQKKYQRINKLRKRQRLGEVGSVPECSEFRGMLRNIMQPFFSPFSKAFGRALDKIMISENMLDTEFFASYSVWYWQQCAIPKRLFEKLIEVDFEGDSYYALSGYDEYLRGLYGDYMQFPPIEQRVPKHKYKAYLKNKEENESLNLE